MSGKTLDEHVKSAKPRSTDAEIKHLRGLKQAEVSASNLTGHEDWDVFLSYLQNALNETLNHKQQFQQQLNSPTVVDHSRMLMLKIGMAECEARIQTLRAVIGLPREIAEKGEKARGILEQTETKKKAG